MEKFQDLKITLKGEQRAWVDLQKLKTLWFNTGTQCNLSCVNCYIESNPKNDRLVYLTSNDVNPYLEELSQETYAIDMIGLTGGEPFINPHIKEIIHLILSKGFKLLILTNAFRILERHHQFLKEINNQFPHQLFLRVSLDHFTKEVHEGERSIGTFDRTIDEIKWLVENGFSVSIAGRGIIGETMSDSEAGYQHLFNKNKISLNLEIGRNLVIFPEMSKNDNVPEITTACWGILNKSPNDQMCASERMIVKRKGADRPVVLACTLLAYDPQFELGETLASADKRVYLNHKFCAKFCVLGGASCSSAK